MNFNENLGKNKLYIFLTLILLAIGILIYVSFKNKSSQIITIPTPTQTPVSTSTPFTVTVKVTKVIDGDTIVIDTGQKIRYIGMDTPETETNECYATEASEINKSLVLGKEVRLEKDVSETDKYGRLLRYVYVGDILIDDYLVKNGYAKTMNIKPDIKYKEQLLMSEKYAKENKLGLWEKCL